MRMKQEHLRTRRKLTLYVPDRFIPYVERAAELAEKEGKSLGTFLWETLAMRLEESPSKARKLKGVLADYALKGVNPEEVREKVKEEVARDAAKEGAVD